MILKLSLRNLFRQKRRNLFLGIGIAFGMMILVIANSFSHGLVDVLINDVVANAAGQLTIKGSEGGKVWMPILRDKERTIKIMKETLGEDLIMIEDSVASFGRAIGNGEVDNAVVVGVNGTEEFFRDFFTLIEGNFEDYLSKAIKYPIIISPQKAKSLNVKVKDVIKVKLPMITGQIQSAKLTVVAIAKANNTFMNIVLFMDDDKVKDLLGYKPWEAAALQMRIKSPKKNAIKYADMLHEKLKPNTLSILVKVKDKDVRIIAFKNNEQSKKELLEKIEIISGNKKKSLDKKGLMLSSKLAKSLGLKVGNSFKFSYETKYRGMYEIEYEINAIYKSSSKLGENILLLNGEKIYNTHNRYLPKNTDLEFFKDLKLENILAKEWKLLDRSNSGEELRKKNKEEARIKSKTSKLDVITMYESASDILKMEGVLNLITLIAVIVLFFIILIGVINTLRMTIKERTREIGSIRAIGMQRKDVKNTFILETVFLTFFSCTAGTILAMIIMFLLERINMSTDNFLSIILKNGNLNFSMDILGILTNFILILIIAFFTAYFPAKKAANLSVATALRHYE